MANRRARRILKNETEKSPAIVALNAGSSSVKFAVFGCNDALPLRLAGLIDGIGTEPSISLRGADGAPEDAPPLPQAARDHATLIASLLKDVIAPVAGEALGVGHR